MLPDLCTTFDLRIFRARLRLPETPVTGVDIPVTREGVLKSKTLKRDKNTAKSRLLRPASPLGLGLQRPATSRDELLDHMVARAASLRGRSTRTSSAVVHQPTARTARLPQLQPREVHVAGSRRQVHGGTWQRLRPTASRPSLAVASFAVASFAVELPSSERGAGLAAPSSLMNHGRREPRVHGESSRIELQPHQHPHPHLPEGTASPAVGTSASDRPATGVASRTQTRNTPRILRTSSAPQAVCSMLSAQPQ